ncbi:pimeloyl-ACP methyl ester carboxylesterase [Allocatelliglobosispora scoriae]|uniref:Pimeloyl-ACP methyl ester carboxylesterase n=1 Tax=Allocatelliglobosispora scoriae TaxID=643052 RepID=A0A841BQ71_9ACTN|nr:alpha/beta fold hydrolase [Allocatelliglobosispora scoriae]MBB5869456.1 pimeloyl-ACP methyl ester carboxylesterase [Allocatelliglobosispora scoriae]
MTPTIIRQAEWSRPVRPVRREVLTATPEVDEGHPPLLFVPGFGHGAWAYAEHWLEHTASRGFAAHAVSLRGHGRSDADSKASLRAYAHDVAQVAASLPRRAVLVGHGAGALVVAHALARYAARAGVLISPILRNRNPLAVLGGKPGARQLFSRELPSATARGYTARIGKASGRARRELLIGRTPEEPVGNPPMLIVGSPDDALVSSNALKQAARAYGGAPLLFPGMGHDVMLDARWREPIDAILDWLEKA